MIFRKKRNKNTRKKIFWIILILAFLISLMFDTLISEKFLLMRNFFLDRTMLIVTFLSSIIMLSVILVSSLIWNREKRRWILPLAVTMLSTAAITTVIKIITSRLRPFQAGIETLPSLIEKSYYSWNSSFPSFHAAIVFAAIPILNKEARKFKYFWIFFAVLVSISRVYFSVHYLSDVIAGAAIGYLTGIFILKTWQKRLKTKEKLSKY